MKFRIVEVAKGYIVEFKGIFFWSPLFTKNTNTLFNNEIPKIFMNEQEAQKALDHYIKEITHKDRVVKEIEI